MQNSGTEYSRFWVDTPERLKSYEDFQEKTKKSKADFLKKWFQWRQSEEPRPSRGHGPSPLGLSDLGQTNYYLGHGKSPERNNGTEQRTAYNVGWAFAAMAFI